MEWIKRIGFAIEYIEENLDKEISYIEAARIACCSTYYFQRIFSYMFGVSLSEYIRRRKMTQAAFDLQRTNSKVIDVALKYGYSSPTSFNRAFHKVHGITPTAAKSLGCTLCAYPSIQFSMKVLGGSAMSYHIEEKEKIRIVGIRVPLVEDAEENMRTRANIIEELIAAGYVQRKKKQLVSTEYGRAFAASLPENVKTAELTAHWEQSLSDIENGIGSAADLLAEIEKTVNSIISIERGRENRVRVTRKQSLGNCPRCGQPVVENSKGFSCSAGCEKCGFFIWGQDKRIGRKYTAAEISELLASGRVTLKNCVFSKGNKYSAVFELDDTGKYVNLNLVEFVGGKKNGK